MECSQDSQAKPESGIEETLSENEDDVDPIDDIIEYLVRCVKLSFHNPHLNEAEVKTKDQLKSAKALYKKSPSAFFAQYGKYMNPKHMSFFDNIQIPANSEGENLIKCIEDLKIYHSDEVTRKRVRNRRYRALQKMQDETDYFSEREMMFRNPLLYEQLVGQYLTDEEIQERDGSDAENLTLVKMILDTVDRNEMRDKKKEQMELDKESPKVAGIDKSEEKASNRKLWGTFETADPKPTHQRPETRKQTMINAPERRLLRMEFLQEMYNSFIDGHDLEVDYNSIDNDEQYDDLKQVSQDAEDRYFDAESNETDNLEQHLKLTEVYKKQESNSSSEDALDTFMEHLNKRFVNTLEMSTA